MSLPIKHLYEFGEFCLDTKEKILMRGDEQLELTPKAFELLTFFVENHGRLLKKDEIMEKIWADSFVEESNLTFNIGQIRKALGDDAQQPIFIKTVRQHGYRFIATVLEKDSSQPIEESLQNPVKDISDTILSTEKQSFSKPESKRNFANMGLIVLLILSLSGGILLYGYFRNKNSNPPILSAPISSEKLSTNGKVGLVAISPDGKKVIYANGTNKQSVWLRQLESGDNTELIPEADQIYKDFAFTPDGNAFYFSRHMNSKLDGAIYRVSLFGGIPQKIVDDTFSPLGISPDGSQLAFVRYPRTDEEYCTVQIADAANGTNERKIASFPKPYYIRDLDFSSDGKKVAFAFGQYNKGTNKVDLAEVDLITGKQQILTTENFSDMPQIARLPQDNGWLITGSKIPVMNYQIWKIPAAGGTSEPITQRGEFYYGLSLDNQAATMVATQIRFEYHIRFIPLTNSSERPNQLDGDTIDIAPDGKIYFTSWMSGNAEIWSANLDGSNRRQLTNNNWEEDTLLVSPDNRSIFYSSIQTEKWFIWQMNIDGSNPKQITSTKGGFPITATSDGEWLYFIEHDEGKLWRISLKTGQEEIVLDKSTYERSFKVLPDASQTAFIEKQGDQYSILIATLPDGKVIKTIQPIDKKLVIRNLSWAKDDKNLIYITKDPATANTILWIQELNEDTPRQIATLTDEEFVAGKIPITPDGKFIAIPQGSLLHDAVLLKGLP